MKTKKTILKYVLVPVVGLILSVGCSKDNNDPTPESPISETPGAPENPNDLSFAAVVAKGGTFAEVPQSRTEDVIAEGADFTEDYREGEGVEAETKRFVCTTKTVSVTDGTGDFQTLGGAASEIYPGALLQGKTINNVKPQAIPLKRAGGSISYNLNDGNSQASQDLDEISESQVRQAMNNIIAGSSGVVPSNFDLTFENVFSEQQVALKMGLSYEGYGVKTEGKLSFSSDRTYNRILVKLNQQYYDVSYDFPTSYDDIFDDSVTPEDLDVYIQPDNPATYIKKVTYGRIFYMLIESTSSLQVMNAEVSASYDGFKNKVEGELEVNTMKKMENLKVKVIAYGGDAQNTFSALGETNVEALADMLSQSTDIRTGLPLSYEIYSLGDPSKQVETNISTEMEIVQCELKGVLPPVAFQPMVDLFDNGIGAATQLYGRYIALFNKAGNQYYIYNYGSAEIEGPYSTTDASAPLGASSFDKVGAALRAFLTKIYIFNEDGTRFEIIDYDQNQSGFPNGPIGTYIQQNGANRQYLTDDVFTGNQIVGDPIGTTSSLDCSTYPFVSKGIQAAARRSIANVELSTTTILPIEVARTRTYFWSLDSNGSSYARLDYYSPGAIINGGEEFRCWADERAVLDIADFRLEQVEAACKVELNDTDYILYFSSDGRMSRQNLDGDIQEGPWAIN